MKATSGNIVISRYARNAHAYARDQPVLLLGIPVSMKPEVHEHARGVQEDDGQDAYACLAVWSREELAGLFSRDDHKTAYRDADVNPGEDLRDDENLFWDDGDYFVSEKTTNHLQQREYEQNDAERLAHEHPRPQVVRVLLDRAQHAAGTDDPQDREDADAEPANSTCPSEADGVQERH
ncbi:MAG: hypothetical protein Q9217_001084 [Psora testacea]